MESFQEEREYDTGRRLTLAEKVRRLESKQRLAERNEDTRRKTKQFKFPFKWRKRFIQSTKKNFRDKMLVFFLNKKNEIEPPKFMPIYEGNMIIWKNKPYEFDPRAVWTVLGMKKSPRAYILKEIDRRPIMNKNGKYIYADSAVSNMDLDEIRERGDSTESDEFLIKAALRAKVASETKKKISIAVILIIIAVVVGLVYFLSKQGGG